MDVVCDTCRRYYDDAYCWTLCPHGPLEHQLKEFCSNCDTVVSKHGPCRHQVAALVKSVIKFNDAATTEAAIFCRDYGITGSVQSFRSDCNRFVVDVGFQVPIYAVWRELEVVASQAEYSRLLDEDFGL